MNGLLDIDELKQIKSNTFTKLDDLKEGWNDDNQKEFYNNKVNELETFMNKAISDFTVIDEAILDLENKLNMYS